MRLIDVYSGKLKEFSGNAIPPYAILSHTWGADEVTYQDLQDIEQAQQKTGFYKIHCACLQAKADGLDWAWVDTCCIDKTSSHELSEAINSMWSWYMNATLCYVYLSDVPGNCPPLRDECLPAELLWIETFEESKWFTRGWTLQELIAPSRVLFFGSCWNPIGPLSNLVGRVSNITGIQRDVLEHRRPLSDLSIARRLSWAANRQTTRVEDRSYSLFGILGVNMPLLYGEGEAKAFLRLQKEIIEHYTDQSLLAWDAPSGLIESREQLLAPSPRCFANSGRIQRRLGTASQSSLRLDSRGLEISLPVMRRQLHEDPTHPIVTLGILDCKYEGSSGALALVMRQHPINSQASTRNVELYVSGFERINGNTLQYGRVIVVNPSDLVWAKPTNLTITNDLRSQPYMQSLVASDPNCFPVWFMGEEPSTAPSLYDVFPAHCWHADSHTMRLQQRYNPFGAIAVSIKESKSNNREQSRVVLITFGLQGGDPLNHRAQPQSAARRIYDMVPIDPECSLESHLMALMDHNPNGAKRAYLRLDRDRRIVARLSGGALKVEIDRGVDERSSVSSASTSSPPSSPLAGRRATSMPSRQDSFMQDARSERSDDSYDIPQRVYRVRGCRYCQFVKAQEGSDRRRAEEKAAERKKKESQRKIHKRAQQAGMGISLGSFLVDGLDLLG